MIVNICKICESSKGEIVLDISNEKDTYLDYINIPYEGINTQYKECSKCGLIFRSHILSDEEKNLLYEKFRDIELRGESKKEYFIRITSLPDEKSENREKCNYLRSFINESGNVLDVGCGAGVFLYKFKQEFKKWSAVGVEPTNEFSNEAEKYGIKIKYGYLNEQTFNKKFDLITMIHVLEHVDNLRDILTQVKSYMHEDSLFYIEVPNSKDIGDLPKSHDRFMSQHDYIFSSRVLEKLLLDSGYIMIDMQEFKSIRNRNNLRGMFKIKI